MRVDHAQINPPHTVLLNLQLSRKRAVETTVNSARLESRSHQLSNFQKKAVLSTPHAYEVLGAIDTGPSGPSMISDSVFSSFCIRQDSSFRQYSNIRWT